MSEVLFAGVAVTDFNRACDWYARLLGRSPDVPVHDHEVMWRIAEDGWLYIVEDAPRAGGALVAIAVDDLDTTLTEVRARHLTPSEVERVGDAGRKATFVDPDGNSISFLEVTQPG